MNLEPVSDDDLSDEERAGIEKWFDWLEGISRAERGEEPQR